MIDPQDIPAFLKLLPRHGAVVEKTEGDRRFSWMPGWDTAGFSGHWTAQELREIVNMMEKYDE